METASAAAGPCAGIRVLDFSTVISGPLPTQALGDLGADVIKVEPPTGDPSRYAGAPFREPGFSAMLTQFNRNKRSIVLDLKQPAAQAAARRLAETCDVVLQNYRPGVAERLGLDYPQLCAGNPGLIFVSITGFGSDGPYAELPAYDHVIQGMTGMMPLQGSEQEPRLVQGGVADKTTGLTALSAVLAALLARERNGGRGQRVDVPMLDAYAAFALPEAMISRTFPPLESDGPSMGSVFRTWETADGHVVGLVIRDAEFQGLCRAIGREDMLDDPRFTGIVDRFANFDAWAEIAEDEIRKLPTREFIARARELGAPFAPVLDVDAFLSDPQTAHNQTAVELPDPRFAGEGSTRYLRHPVRYERTPATLRRHPPRLGEHTDEVLSEAGFSPDEIAELRSGGSIR